MDYRVSGESLTAVADAIRERAGKTELLAFPEEYESVVRGIPDYLAQATNRTLVSYASDEITSVRGWAFEGVYALVTISLPNCGYVDYQSFKGCSKLANANFPKLDTIANDAFLECSSLKKMHLPSATTIRADAFRNTALEAFVLSGSNVCSIASTNVFDSTPIANGTGYIYVPRALVDSYKAATNWAAFESQIRAIEDYPEITGG